MYRAVILLLLSGFSYAHEMTPTYPKWEPSHVEGVWKTKLKMFNKRSDVEWYEIGVFDKEWQPVYFVSSYKLIKMPYLSHVEFEVYVSTPDKAEYICSKSKLKANLDKESMIASRICSRFK